ncbi:MAG TPA: PAS-domain containing protein [Dongiaceae bacterium]|nr:PAS-domain containing protein [Dongiaceae bacterium]
MPLPLWAGLAAGAICYFLTAQLGLAFATTKAVSPFWPAAGLAVALLLQFGLRMWPAVAVGAFAANALLLNPGIALIIAGANTLEAIAGALILRRLIERPGGTLILARTAGYVLSAGFATMISATIGVLVLYLAGVVTGEAAPTTWFTWWGGDALGILVMTSALLALRRTPGAKRGLLRLGQAVGVVVAIVALLALFRAQSDAAWLIFLAFPVVFVASRLLGPRGGTWTVLALAVGVIAETVSGAGPFVSGPLSDNMLDLQVFIAVLALAGLVFTDLHQLDLRVPGAVCIAGTAIALVASLAQDRQHHELEELRFKQLTETATERIRERASVYGNAMRSAAGLYAVTNQITPAQWRDFVASLTLVERYPGIAGIGIVVPVKPEQVDPFVAAQRAAGKADFSVKSIPGGDPRSPDAERFVVQLMEPAENAGILGVDVATEVSRREAASAARDTGLPAISGPVLLVSDPRQRTGFHLYLPVYDTPTPPYTVELRRAHFRSWILGRFVIQDFFDAALMPMGDAIIAEIFDGPTVDAGKLLTSTWATWGVFFPEMPGNSGRRAVTALPLAGHMFTVQWHTGPGFAREQHRIPIVVGSVIVLLTILLAALVANLQSLRQRATVIAEQMTSALAASNERFELAMAGTRDGIWDWDIAGRKLWGSPRCRQMLGYDEAELPDELLAWRALLLPQDQSATRAAFDRVSRGASSEFDVVQRYRHKDGRIVHLHNQAFAVRDGKGRLIRLVGAFTDITPMVQAQEQLRAAISVMEDGFGLFDADDRIVLYNEAFMDEGSRKILGNDVTGRRFEEIVRAFAYHDMPVDNPSFDREAWIAQRMERHRNPPEMPIDVQWSGGRWMRISERRTADGGYVGIWTDITAVKVAEQRLLAAIDSMADGFALFDAEDRLVYYNKGFVDENMSKLFAEPRGRTFEEIMRAFAYDDVTAVAALLDREKWIKQRVERHRNPPDEPSEQQTTNGKWFRVYERRTADGGYLGTWTDISALKAAESRVRDAIESINEGFALLDADMRFVIVNSNFVSMYPLSGKLAVPGGRLEDMLRYGAEHGEYPGITTPVQVEAFVRKWMERYASGDRYLGEGEMPDGSWYLVSHHPTANAGYVSIRADITSQKKREAELSVAMVDLEVKTLELGVLADELEQARRVADLANLGKSQFLANMAHELRTPLNAINGFSEIILKEMFGPMPERYKGYVEFIQQGGTHLLSLINDILDLSKIEAGKMDLHVEAVPTEQIAYQAIETVHKAAEERKLTLNSDIAADCPIMHADPRSVRQILLNLMSNAVKFTPHFGTVTLSVRRSGDSGIEVKVADSGIGMGPEEIVKALEPYGQVESDLSKKHKGTGLGLPLVKSLAELHGGSMRVESERGKGTTVTVLLPWDNDLPRDLG